MREGGGGTLFSPPIERKKVGLKISEREESNDPRRRLSGGYLSYMGGKSIANLPADRLKGGSSIHNSKHHIRENGLSEQPTVEKTRDSFESDNYKLKCAEEGVLPHWGHGKRSRCSRLEQSKAPIGESASHLGKAEKRPVGGSSQANGTAKVRGQATLRESTPAARVAVSGAARRNGHQGVPDNGVVFSSSKGYSAANGARLIAAGTGDDKREEVLVSSQKVDQGVLLACSRQKISQASSEATLLPTNCNGEGAGAAAAPPSLEAVACAVFAPAQALPAGANRRVDLDAFEWPRIFISLSRKEKEDDFLILKGTKLPQRPKKRSKVVEKALHFCMPGNWLGDLTRGRYDVREKKSVKKKPRGLKAMESMDSDSE